MSEQIHPKSKQREPPPFLFLHPSPAASHVSIPGNPVLGFTSTLERTPSNRSTVGVSSDGLRPARPLLAAESTRSTEKTDALWAEMQATLEEVELSASGGTHVFGPEHDRKLADLRAAQIALAQAWARSEADDAIETAQRDPVRATAGDEVGNLRGALGDAGTDGNDATRATGGPGNAPHTDGSGGGTQRLGTQLEEDTEKDIVVARKRREANDRYFQRVSQGVIDVVTRLEDVAVAMRAVEQENKDVWSEGTSIADASRM